jgi:GR25 family glycosyltransferase involved in LPS biosynthesis
MASSSTPKGAYVPPHRRRKQQESLLGSPIFAAAAGAVSAAPEESSTNEKNDTATPTTTSPAEEDTRTRTTPVTPHRYPTMIRCINLAQRTDKWRHMRDQCRRVGDAELTDKLQRFEAVDGGGDSGGGGFGGGSFDSGSGNNEASSPSTVRHKNNDDDDEEEDEAGDVVRDWDSTTNALFSPQKVRPGQKHMTNGEVGCARSHIALWRELVATATTITHDDDEHNIDAAATTTTTMLILEDDVAFTKYKGHTRFARAFENAWQQLPEGWGILYLGFSSRGERVYLDETETTTTTTTPPPEPEPRHRPTTRWSSLQQQQQQQQQQESHIMRQQQQYDPVVNPQVRLYRPEYGYHTHAYVVTRAAAATLLRQLPVTGPLDVWLADHHWFDLPVYCAVIANEGWRREEDGEYEGAILVRQDRRKYRLSDVAQSANTDDHNDSGNSRRNGTTPDG